MTSLIDLIETVVDCSVLFAMLITLTVEILIIAVLVWGRTIVKPRNPIYSFSLIFIFLTFASRATQLATSILLAFNRITAVMWPFQYSKIWIKKVVIIAIGYQIFPPLFFGGLAAYCDLYWYYSEARRGWYTMFYERDYTKIVMNVIACFVVLDIAVMVLLYTILLVKMRSFMRVGQKNDSDISNAAKQERSLFHLAIAFSTIEVLYDLVFFYLHIYSSAPPYLLIVFCRPVRDGLKVIHRMSSTQTNLATHDALRAARHAMTCISLPLAISALIVIGLCTREAAKPYSICLALIVIIDVMADVEMQLIWDPLILLPKICLIRYHSAIAIPGTAPTHYVIWVGIVSMIAPNLIACFLYRHQAVLSPDSRWRLSSKLRICLFLTFYFLCAASVALGKAAEVSDPSSLLQEVQVYWPGMPLATAGCFDKLGLSIFGAASMFMISTCLCIIIAATLHTFAQLKKISTMSEKMRLFHRTMTKVLVIQSIVPLVLLILPLTIQTLAIFSKLRDSTILSVCVLLMSFHSPVHSLTLLISTPMYRKKVVQIVRQVAFTRDQGTTVFQFSKISLY